MKKIDMRNLAESEKYEHLNYGIQACFDGCYHFCEDSAGNWLTENDFDQGLAADDITDNLQAAKAAKAELEWRRGEIAETEIVTAKTWPELYEAVNVYNSDMAMPPIAEILAEIEKMEEEIDWLIGMCENLED